MTPIIEDSTAGGGTGEIVIGLNGSKDTYALKGEEYLETDAHAAEPTDGLLNAKIKISDKVDTSKPGTYKVSYRVSDSSGHTAKACLLYTSWSMRFIALMRSIVWSISKPLNCGAAPFVPANVSHCSAAISFP